jgi:WD domain, G-beta repeat
VVSAHLDGTMRLWDVSRGEPVGEPWRAHTGGVLSVAINADGTRIISGGMDKTLRLWDISSAQPIGDPWRREEMEAVTKVVLSPDGERVFSAGNDAVRSWRGPANVVGEVCAMLASNMSSAQWRRLVSKEIDYEAQCPKLPVPKTDSATPERTQTIQSAPVRVEVRVRR